MALVMRSDRELALGGGRALDVVDEARGLQQRAAEMDERRIDRDRHHHRQIWTKDAHGGPYRKAAGSTGYDALLQSPDGCDKLVEPGYERPQAGPTTNFVGNHMTQGAIDLVQMQLQRPKPQQQHLLTAGMQQAAILQLPQNITRRDDDGAAPDLAALRKALRVQRVATCKAPAIPVALCTTDQPTRLPSAVPQTVAQRDACDAENFGGSLKAAEQAAEEAWSVGDYATALRLLSAIIPQHLHDDQHAQEGDEYSSHETGETVLCRLLLQRAACHRELGNVNRVIDDCTSAISCAVSDVDAGHALLSRAMAYLDMEKYDSAAADVQKVAEAGLGQRFRSQVAVIQRSLSAARQMRAETRPNGPSTGQLH